MQSTFFQGKFELRLLLANVIMPFRNPRIIASNMHFSPTILSYNILIKPAQILTLTY